MLEGRAAKFSLTSFDGAYEKHHLQLASLIRATAKEGQAGPSFGPRKLFKREFS